MIQDKSMDYQKTWTFLDRRIEDAVHLYAVLAQTETTTTHMQRAISTAFTTVVNIIFYNLIHFSNQIFLIIFLGQEFTRIKF